MNGLNVQFLQEIPFPSPAATGASACCAGG
jgi:hypothetical protein